jgi:hypothetical protein
MKTSRSGGFQAADQTNGGLETAAPWSSFWKSASVAFKIDKLK